MATKKTSGLTGVTGVTGATGAAGPAGPTGAGGAVPGSGATVVGEFSLLPWLKMFKLPYVTGSGKNTINWANAYLTTNGTIPAKTGGGVIEGLSWLIGQYPELGYQIQGALGMNDLSTTKDGDAVWLALNRAKFTPSKYVTPQMASAQANTAVWKNAYNAGMSSGWSSAVSSATANEIANANDNINNTIESWNYTKEQKEFLAGVAKQLITRQGDHLINQNALLSVIRGQQPSGLGAAVDAKIARDYEAAYPGLISYNQQPGANRMNESQYSTFVTNIQDSTMTFGAPMPTTQQIGQMLNNHISSAEYKQRISDIYTTVSNADAQTKALLKSEYGITDQDLMHYIVTGKLPNNKEVVGLQTMQRDVATASIQAYAAEVGLNGLNQAGATSLADTARLSATAGNSPLATGIGTIKTELQNAAKDVALTQSNPGAAVPTVNTNTLIASQQAGFMGINQVAAESQVQRAEAAKVAPFEKGGGYAESAKGVIGLGAART